MNRRSFVRLSLAGAAGGLLVPQLAPRLAMAKDVNSALASHLAGHVYFTKASPGRWEKKVASHSPVLEVQDGGETITVQVVTNHGMHGYEHYIVKHILLDQKMAFIAEHMFDPTKDEAPISKFELPAGYSGPIYAISMCNKHDTWIDGIEV